MSRHLIFHNARPSFLTSTGKRTLKHFYQIRKVRWASTLPVQKRDHFWIPTVSLKKQDESLDATQLLLRAGYLRQAYSGIYHMLPLGLRVQEKLEKLIDKHMRSIEASKVSLSSISSQALWQKSGRLSVGSEFFRFSDRKDARWLLAPTHEEEITSLVADVVHSPNQLPVRLYQISRKYRDERRPRGGLLRGREFVMKDLYTFDATPSEARLTYESVRKAYRNFLDELKIRYIEARADSGSMGGNLSHEYHFPNTAGEDDVISCNNCDYARNEEWVPNCNFSVKDIPTKEQLGGHLEKIESPGFTTINIIGNSRSCLVKVFAPYKTNDGQPVGINTYAVKRALDSIVELDTGVEEATNVFAKSISQPNSSDKGTVYYLFDPSIGREQAYAVMSRDMEWLTGNNLEVKMVMADPGSTERFSLLKQASGDSCPNCQDGVLIVDKAIEVGHTFHLGTRYSSKLDLSVRLSEKTNESMPVQMGCHGIGVSRLVAAIASSLSDETGLNWPRVVAPFEAIVVVDGNDAEKSKVAANICHALADDENGAVDTLLDDRNSVSNGYKLKDADLIGYPVILVVGRTWQNSKEVEIQCRRLGVKDNVRLEDVSGRVRELLAQL